MFGSADGPPSAPVGPSQASAATIAVAADALLIGRLLQVQLQRELRRVPQRWKPPDRCSAWSDFVPPAHVFVSVAAGAPRRRGAGTRLPVRPVSGPRGAACAT